MTLQTVYDVVIGFGKGGKTIAGTLANAGHNVAMIEKLRGKNYYKLADNPNITVIDGTAFFISPHKIQVQTAKDTLLLEGERFYINTGSSPFVPPIPGLDENPYVYISETLLDLEERPESMVITGGGYVGIEFAKRELSWEPIFSAKSPTN